MHHFRNLNGFREVDLEIGTGYDRLKKWHAKASLTVGFSLGSQNNTNYEK